MPRQGEGSVAVGRARAARAGGSAEPGPSEGWQWEEHSPG